MRRKGGRVKRNREVMIKQYSLKRQIIQVRGKEKEGGVGEERKRMEVRIKIKLILISLTSKTKKRSQIQLKRWPKLNKKRNLYLKVPSNINIKEVDYLQIYPIHQLKNI